MCVANRLKVPCLQDAIRQAGCDDLGCICEPDRQKSIRSKALPCAMEACSPIDLSTAVKTAEDTCAAYLSTNGSVPPNIMGSEPSSGTAVAIGGTTLFLVAFLAISIV